MHSISLSTFPLFLSKEAYATLHFISLFQTLAPAEPDKVAPALLRSYSFNTYQSFEKLACHTKRRRSEVWWRERDSNPRCPFRNIHDFQSCSFNHSDTSPNKNLLLRIQLLQRNFNITWSFFSRWRFSTFFSNLNITYSLRIFSRFFATSNCISKISQNQIN